MKNNFALLLLHLLVNICCGQVPNEKNTDTVITKNKNGILTVKFNTSGMLRFNYINKEQLSSTLDFKNPAHTDTSVSYILTSAKPIHMYAVTANFIPGNIDPVMEYKTLLVMPGDSIVVDQIKQHVVFSNYGIGYIDSIIDSKNFYDRNLPYINNALKEHGLRYLVDQIEIQYQTVKRKLDRYSKNNNDKYLDALYKLNYIWKMNKIGGIPLDAKQFSSSENSVLDSMYKDVENNFDIISSINSPFCYSILYSLISYNAFKQGRFTNNYWDYFNAGNPSILKSDLYKSFVLNKMNVEFNFNKRIDSLVKLITKVENAGIVDSRYDSLLQTKVHLKRELSQSVYAMQKANGEMSEYSSILRSLKGNYVFVDFWASWCGPCRGQMPYLRKMKPELSEKNVKFVSISIDNDNQIDDWIAASKDEGLDKELLNFRLQKGNLNLLLKTLEITAVPRYFLYDPQGKLISGNFITPDKKEFKQTLLKEISK